MSRHISRRSLLSVVGAGVSASLAGCTSSLPLVGGDGGAVEGADNWPNQRGSPSNTGRSTSGGPGPDATHEMTANVRDGINVGHEAPTIGDDAIYCVGTHATPYEQDPVYDTVFAYALSREDGTEQWRQVLAEREGVENVNDNRLSNPTSCVGPDGFYITWIARGGVEVTVVKLSRSDGTEEWRKTYGPTDFFPRQPVARDGSLYLFDDRYRVVSLSTDDGSEEWRTDPMYNAQSYPTVGPDAVGVAHIGFIDGSNVNTYQLTVFDRSDGTERWTVELGRDGWALPVIAGDSIYAMDGDPYGSRLPYSGDQPRRIYAFSLEDGSEQWTHAYDNEATATGMSGGGTGYVTVAGDSLYYALGFGGPGRNASEERRNQQYTGPNVFALDRETGEVQWESQLGEHARVFAPMVADGSRLYALRTSMYEQEESAFHVLDSDSGEVLGSFGADDEGRAFALADGALYEHRGEEIYVWR